MEKEQFRWSHLPVPYVQYKVFSSFDGIGKDFSQLSGVLVLHLKDEYLIH